jgi:hypothetical protein
MGESDEQTGYALLTLNDSSGADILQDYLDNNCIASGNSMPLQYRIVSDNSGDYHTLFVWTEFDPNNKDTLWTFNQTSGTLDLGDSGSNDYTLDNTNLLYPDNESKGLTVNGDGTVKLTNSDNKVNWLEGNGNLDIPKSLEVNGAALNATDTKIYTGTLNGNGKTIRNLKLNPSGATSGGGGGPVPIYKVSGLFTYIAGGTVKNLTIDLGSELYVMNLSGGQNAQCYVGLLAGQVTGNSRITAVTVKGALKFNYPYPYVYRSSDTRLFGGIAGDFGGNELSACVSQVTISAVGGCTVYAGSLAGKLSLSTGNTVSYNHADGSVSVATTASVHTTQYGPDGSFGHYVGGLAGWVTGPGKLIANTASGAVSVSVIIIGAGVLNSIYAGGLIGQLGGAALQDSSASGNVTISLSGSVPPESELIYADSLLGANTGGAVSGKSSTGAVTINR